MEAMKVVSAAALATNLGLALYYFWKDDYQKATFFMVCAISSK